METASLTKKFKRRHPADAEDMDDPSLQAKRRKVKHQPEEAKNRLMRFLTQPENGPMFRQLDLRHVPVHVLQRTDLHYAFKHMTRLSHVVYPKRGWPEKSLRHTFLAAIPSGVTKEADQASADLG